MNTRTARGLEETWWNSSWHCIWPCFLDLTPIAQSVKEKQVMLTSLKLRTLYIKGHYLWGKRPPRQEEIFALVFLIWDECLEYLKSPYHSSKHEQTSRFKNGKKLNRYGLQRRHTNSQQTTENGIQCQRKCRSKPRASTSQLLGLLLKTGRESLRQEQKNSKEPQRKKSKESEDIGTVYTNDRTTKWRSHHRKC